MVRFTYADHDEVAEIIKSGQAGKDFLIVDVRDDDFAGGNITGARNVPSAEFNDRIEDLIKDTENVPKVIVSFLPKSRGSNTRSSPAKEVRGPKMARIYAEEAERKGHKVKLAFEKEAAAKDDTKAVDESKDTSPGSSKTEQEVIVLRGGFTRWQEKYRNDPQLVENWKASIWASPYN